MCSWLPPCGLTSRKDAVPPAKRSRAALSDLTTSHGHTIARHGLAPTRKGIDVKTQSRAPSASLGIRVSALMVGSALLAMVACGDKGSSRSDDSQKDEDRCASLAKEAESLSERGVIQRSLSGAASESDKKELEAFNARAKELEGVCGNKTLAGGEQGDGDEVPPDQNGGGPIDKTGLPQDGVPTPTVFPTVGPTQVPTAVPTQVPTAAPTAVPTAPVPVVTPTPQPTGVPGPGPDKGVVCGVKGSSITLNGKVAFTHYSESERFAAYLELQKAGVCTITQTTCGVNGSAITLDGNNAFTYYDESERKSRYLDLQRAGVCKVAQTTCGVHGSTITLDGKNAFTYYDEFDRIARYLELQGAGVCKVAQATCGVNGSSITLDGKNAFTFYGESDRMARYLALQRAGTCTVGRVECGVEGSAITLDGKPAFTIFSGAELMAKYLELQSAGVCK